MLGAIFASASALVRCDASSPTDPDPGVRAGAASAGRGGASGGTSEGGNAGAAAGANGGGEAASGTAGLGSGGEPDSGTGGSPEGGESSAGAGAAGDAAGGESGADTGPYVAVSSGQGPFVCGLTEEGQPHCWGAADYDHPSLDPYYLPLRSIVAAEYIACFVTAQSWVKCARIHSTRFDPGPTGLEWSMDEYAQVDVNARLPCGLSTSGGIVRPGSTLQAEPAIDGTFTQLSLGGNSADCPMGSCTAGCALRTSGELACWIWSDGDEVEWIEAPEGEFRQVSVGSDYACALDPAGAATCWGESEYGAATPPEGEFESITTGPRQACGVRPGGSVECWGDDQLGQSTPPDELFSQVSARSYNFTCGVTLTGWIRCWGDTSTWETLPPG